MNAPLMTLAAIAAVGLLFVVMPVVTDVYLRFRARRTVGCPETGLAAEVQIDARRAAATAIPGPARLRVVACSLWPERAGCAQKCLAHAR
jgi:hypothetical protein